MYKCDKCNEIFEKWQQKANHIRWKHSKIGATKFVKQCEFCGDDHPQYTIENHELTCIKNPKNFGICKECGEIVRSAGGIGLFCSKSCSAIYTNKNRSYKPSDDKRTKIVECKECNIEIEVNIRSGTKTTRCNDCRHHRSKLLRKDYNGREYNYKIYECVCEVCNEKFGYLGKKKRKTCSKECYSNLLSKKAKLNPNCGGETNYKRYYYRNIYMDSSWEVEIAKWMDTHNIKWERSRKHILYWFDEKNEKRRYYPDFYLPELNIYLDPKNKYLMKKDEYKLNRVVENNNICLLNGDVEGIKNNLKNILGD